MNELQTNFSFFDLFPDLPLISIVDVGALPLEEIDGEEVYSHLMQTDRVKLIGFEPNQNGCLKLKKKYGEPHRFFPFFIGDGKPAVFHKTVHPMTGSLYAPNVDLISSFPGLLNAMEPIGTERVTTHRLDDVVDLDEIDFLKMDVQGGELSVLKGAPRLAGNALLIQTEAEFVPLYQNQPLFADLDTHLRSIGFQFHTFLGFGIRPYESLDNTFPESKSNQMLWTDAVYIPNILRLDDYSDVRLLKLAALLHDCYRSVDLTLKILKVLENRGRSKPLEIYLEQLSTN